MCPFWTPQNMRNYGGEQNDRFQKWRHPQIETHGQQHFPGKALSSTDPRRGNHADLPKRKRRRCLHQQADLRHQRARNHRKESGLLFPALQQDPGVLRRNRRHA